jgi:hypothetical protein
MNIASKCRVFFLKQWHEAIASNPFGISCSLCGNSWEPKVALFTGTKPGLMEG